MIRRLRRRITRQRTNDTFRSAYAQYSAACAKRERQPLPYRRWREAVVKSSLKQETP